MSIILFGNQRHLYLDIRSINTLLAMMILLLGVCLPVPSQEVSGTHDLRIAPYLYSLPPVTYDKMPVFRWTSMSYYEKAKYKIKIYKKEKSVFTPHVVVSVNDTVYTQPLPFEANKQYVWSVSSVFSNDKEVSSSFESFTIKDSAAPLLLSTQKHYPKRVVPVLRWHRPAKTSGEVQYQLWVKDSTFKVTLYNQVTLDTVKLLDSLYVPHYIGTVYWFVNTSAANSDTATFCRYENTVPAIISYQGFNGESVFKQKSAQPRVAWYSVPGDTVYYWVHLSQKSSFVSSNKFPVNDTIVTIPAALTPGLWYWKVFTNLSNKLLCGYDSFYVDQRIVSGVKNTFPLGIHKSLSVLFAGQKNVVLVANQHDRYITQLRVFDCHGRTVLVKNVAHSIVNWDYTTSNGIKIQRGVYVLRVFLDDQTCVHLKLIR